MVIPKLVSIAKDRGNNKRHRAESTRNNESEEQSKKDTFRRERNEAAEIKVQQKMSVRLLSCIGKPKYEKPLGDTA